MISRKPGIIVRIGSVNNDSANLEQRRHRWFARRATMH
jgi:hypothetical protein